MNTKSITQVGVFIAIGIILPPVFHAVGLGNIVLPMHFAPLLCGLLSGPKEGFMCGIILPIASFIIMAMPPLYPVGISMCIELSAYGFVIGLLMQRLLLHIGVYLSSMVALISAMLAGRLLSGVFYFIFFQFHGEVYTWSIFLSTMFIKALPGIIIQIIVIPFLATVILKKSNGSTLFSRKE